ncbi:MAG: dNTP triphosphohydrolase, partial [Deltaproteobacteria bacterium]|nr:dNTP triphosphohydrolase [Deltaproteobacteria bacterium]
MNNERVFNYGYAGKEKKEKGVRTPFQIDRDRIIHSSAFRRMRNKTQVFGVFTLDYYRTRLTHSLEVSQIARAVTSILNKKYGLNIDIDLVEAVSLAHDIGHAPFGHLGESIINDELKKATGKRFGFEANAQNIRILNFLEKKFYDSKNNKIYGINPAVKTIDGILKYKIPYSLSDKNKHFIYDNDIFILEKLHGKDFINYLKKYSRFLNDPKNKEAKENFFEFSRCIECQILNAADDIAYATHDIEDG